MNFVAETMRPPRWLPVVVPCYNEEKLRSETMKCMKSVCDKLENLKDKLIFVNDGSRDHTRELLKLFASQDARSKLIGTWRGVCFLQSAPAVTRSPSIVCPLLASK